jgi:hypothetical protein
METEDKETKEKLKMENKENKVSTSSLATILHGLKYNLKEEMVALTTAKELDEKALIEKAHEIRNLDLHVNACYGIGGLSFKVEGEKS